MLPALCVNSFDDVSPDVCSYDFSSVWVDEWPPLGKEQLTIDYMLSLNFVCCDLSYFLGLTLKSITSFILLKAMAVGIRLGGFNGYLQYILEKK